MKKILILFVLALSVVMVQAQNTTREKQNNQQNTVKQDKVPSKVLSTFKQNFPSAKNVAWNKYRNYYEASFMQENKNYYVAFTPSGEWIQTSVAGSMNELPGEVKEDFQSSEYSTYEIKSIRQISGVGNDQIYMVEVISIKEDTTGPVYLYYEPTGNLYRVGSNQLLTGSPVVKKSNAKQVTREELPPLVENAFVETHPDVKNVRWHMEDNRYVAEYSEKGQRMYFISSPEGEWQSTTAEYNFSQLPQPVQDAYNKAQYKDWEIYNVEYVRPAYSEDENNVKFRIHLYKLNNENDFTYKSLTYDPSGNLLKVEQ